VALEAKNEQERDGGQWKGGRGGKRQWSPGRDGLWDKQGSKTIKIWRINTEVGNAKRINDTNSYEHEKKHIMVKVRLHKKHNMVTINGILDSGAMEGFINQRLCQKHDIQTKKTGISQRIFLVDGKESTMGPITHIAETTMEIINHEEDAVFQVAKLNNHKMVLGMPWLRQHYPTIDWASHKITFDSKRCTTSCLRQSPVVYTVPEAEGIEENLHVQFAEVQVRQEITPSGVKSSSEHNELHERQDVPDG
jgi:hypothetical protein